MIRRAKWDSDSLTRGDDKKLMQKKKKNEVLVQIYGILRDLSIEPCRFIWGTIYGYLFRNMSLKLSVVYLYKDVPDFFFQENMNLSENRKRFSVKCIRLYEAKVMRLLGKEYLKFKYVYSSSSKKAT